MAQAKDNDNQITGLSGEYFIAAELLKRGYQAVLTVGNAKAIDLMVLSPTTQKFCAVEVKTLRSLNCYSITKKSITPKTIYAFVILNFEGIPPDYYILTGKEILRNPKLYFGSSLGKSRETINYGPLKPFKDAWTAFDTL